MNHFVGLKQGLTNNRYLFHEYFFYGGEEFEFNLVCTLGEIIWFSILNIFEIF